MNINNNKSLKMKRLSTLLLVLTALMALPLTASAAETTFDFENNPQGWPVGEGVNFADGNLTSPLIVGEVTLANVQGDASQPARIMRANDGVSALYVYKNGSIQLSVAEGRAITKMEVTMKSGSSFDLAASTGAVEANVWTGNAQEVLFTSSATRMMLKLVVTTDDADDATVKPAVETFDVEAENIAAFNAVEDGKTVKLTLKDAQVNVFDDIFNFYFIEDATGATGLTGVSFNAGDCLNGYIIGTKSSSALDYSGEYPDYVEIKLAASNADNVKAEAGELKSTPIEVGAIADGKNHGRLLTVNNVEIRKEGRFYYAYSGDDRVQVKDAYMVLPYDYEWPEQAKSVTGVATYNGARWQLAPTKAEDIVEAGTEEPVVATFDFTSENLRGYMGESLSDVKGYILNETYTVENVRLTITAGSAPSRIYSDKNRGNCLVMYKEYSTLTFVAPEGKAIEKVEFTYAGSGSLDFTASPAGLEGNVWTGNAEAVRFLDNATAFLSNAVVTLTDKSAETIELMPIVYTEVANLAEFNDLENGTYAQVTLKDAEVTGKSADGSTTVFVQDATGGAWIQYTTLNDRLQEQTKISGTFYVVKRVASGNPQMKETEDTPQSEFTVESADQLTCIEGSIAEVNVAQNLNRVVKISGANLTVSNNSGVLTQNGVSINVNNGTATANQQLHKIDDWTDQEDINMVAILVATTNTPNLEKNQLLPISIEKNITDGIATVNASDADVEVYNLQGIRLNRLQKGLNIVGGKKVLR